MLTRKQPLLIAEQGIHWSHQRLLAIAAQICLLILTVTLLSNVIITIGERRLQEDWAIQRYSELQAVGTVIADKIAFQQFRTQMFAKSELLKRYLEFPSSEREEKLTHNWNIIRNNIPELLDLALFDPQGNFKFATSDDFGREPLPAVLLGASRNMGGDEIYTSPLEFSPIKGKLEPYMYQLAWLENPDQSIRGYLVTYTSMAQILKSIKPAYSSSQSPLLMLDTQGLLYAGAEATPPLQRIPDTMGGSLRQSYPALWRKMAISNFGQFHGDNATFVYLKVEFTDQYETRREYFLVSYILNDDIAAKFTEWRSLLVVGASVLTILASLLIFLSHLYRLEQGSRKYSIELSSRLFCRNIGCIIVRNSRVISANKKAAEQLGLPKDELLDRSLQRLLHLEDHEYSEIMLKVQHDGEWIGEFDSGGESQAQLIAHIKTQHEPIKNNQYLLITFEDVSELNSARNDAYINQMLNDSAVPTALIQADGNLVRTNQAFNEQLQIQQNPTQDLTELLNRDLGNKWSQILQQIILQGSWKGQVICSQNNNSCLQATLRGHLDPSGEIEYIVCTFEQAVEKKLLAERGELVPHRTTVLVNLRDLESYFKSLEPKSRETSSLILMDITAESMLSHMSDIGQLENRQKEVELKILRDLPAGYQMSHWQLGKLIIILPNTDADKAHHFAIKSMSNLSDIGLSDGICMGIAAYQTGLTLEQYLSNAEVALKRAKQTGEQMICQAFTRQNIG
ncbi:PAS domain-containing protein [Shewanella sp. D64]|uniref:PAS domain-containing protein n=1 Tax=unclassified Shewanella TaxID=196818 RepID=UPI0022BA4511|nr:MULTISPECIES: PAS domain-containing protein [unclassified Shewanella]MEC4728209.1 PAS domain-containing protein [Shewanella sp. D64]MEC4740006.1 PAS domain-containing protein [Shewanella sp. E94]WBJ94362.1 PAS domain-containing protein [Shewanella sp. MTB7]